MQFNSFMLICFSVLISWHNLEKVNYIENTVLSLLTSLKNG